MFSKLSRYRRLPDVVALDAAGRALESKALRLLPAAPGDVLHTVEEGDRLDHLAFKYYKQPRDWWRIADANPDVLSPFALLGDAPHVTVRLDVSWEGPAPPWGDLGRLLRDTLGVEAAVMGAPGQERATATVEQGPLLFDLPPALVAALDVSAAAQVLSPALTAALAANGVTFADGVRVEKPDAVTWVLTDRVTRAVTTLRSFPSDGLLNVYGSLTRWDWAVTVIHNAFDVTSDALVGLVEATDFGGARFAVPEPPAVVRRAGKPIVVPPRRDRA